MYVVASFMLLEIATFCKHFGVLSTNPFGLGYGNNRNLNLQVYQKYGGKKINKNSQEQYLNLALILVWPVKSKYSLQFFKAPSV